MWVFLREGHYKDFHGIILDFFGEGQAEKADPCVLLLIIRCTKTIECLKTATYQLI